MVLLDCQPLPRPRFIPGLTAENAERDAETNKNLAEISDGLVNAILAEKSGLDDAGRVWEDGNLIVDMSGWLYKGITMDDQQEDSIASNSLTMSLRCIVTIPVW